MSAEEEKKFVIKHTLTDVRNMKNKEHYYGEKKWFFNIPWRMAISTSDSNSLAWVNLECLKLKGENEWSIDTFILAKVFTKDGEKVFEEKRVFTKEDRCKYLDNLEPLDAYLVDGNLTIECHVTINSMTGIDFPIMRSFDDESAKETSDVVLKVENQKFYVLKKYLALHSTYFKSFFLGKFDESNQSEIELKDIDPNYFQKFLEVLYASPDINDDTVEGILELSYMFDAKTVFRQCEKFLVGNSKRNFERKFLLATQYKLEGLKNKCMPEFKTFEDIAAVIPEDPLQIDHAVWKELLSLSISFHREKSKN